MKDTGKPVVVPSAFCEKAFFRVNRRRVHQICAHAIFFLWDYLKIQVCQLRPGTLDAPKEVITREVAVSPPEITRRQRQLVIDDYPEKGLNSVLKMRGAT